VDIADRVRRGEQAAKEAKVQPLPDPVAFTADSGAMPLPV